LIGVDALFHRVSAWTSDDVVASLGLSAVAVIAAVALYRRWLITRGPALGLVSFGVISWAAGTALMPLERSVLELNTWVAPSFALQMVLPITGLVVVWRMVSEFSQAMKWVYFVDAMIMSTAATFVAWELGVAPATQITALSVLDQIGLAIPIVVHTYVASLWLLLLLLARAPARWASVTAWSLFAVASVFSSRVATQFGHGWSSVALLCSAVAIALATLLPRLRPAPPPVYDRPKLSRTATVYGFYLVGVWLATLLFVVQDRQPSFITAIVGVWAGGVLVAGQVVSWRLSDHLSVELHRHVTDLSSAGDYLRNVIDDLDDVVLVLNGEGRVREVNRATLELLGMERADVLGQHFLALLPTEARTEVLDAWMQLMDPSTIGDVVAPLIFTNHADGRAVALETNVRTPIVDPDRVVVSLRNVTESLERSRELTFERERFRMAFHRAPIGMAVSRHSDSVLLEVNQPLADMLGYTPDEMVGRHVGDFVHPDDWRNSPSVDERARRGLVDERRYVRKDGSAVWTRVYVSIMEDELGVKLIVGHVEDVTERRSSAERLEWAATHDALTRLPNRFRFLDQLAVQLESSADSSVAVLFIDIDNFKVINDSLGHAVGDQLLVGMSERLRAVVRDRDLLGRFGGDEFIVMLTDIGAFESPIEIAERLRREIAQPLVVDGGELFVTASIGIATAGRSGVSTTDLLRDADAAMYRAKARGRDCVEVFNPDTHDATVKVLRTTNDLRRGLERGEFEPYFQPIVDLATGALTGFEVLARWRHPDRGLLGPDQFLGLAEETGQIGDLGTAMLRSSLSQLARWRAVGDQFASLNVSVNVSVRQLMSGRFHQTVSDVLAETGVNADSLWLEITETALMSDVKAATVALRDLRNLGIHLAVDDFGTGYSSLTYLKRFPVEAIKVDRSFVSGLGIDAEDSAIVDAVIKLGKSLGLMVVAEGVETPLQLARLREGGCTRGQGFLFGRPRPASMIEAEYSLQSSLR
jgi:diguanylate cyclase (GGDEF)-like protein/PAS domain S-box-containing protein